MWLSLLLSAALWGLVAFAGYLRRQESALSLMVLILGMTGMVGTFYPTFSEFAASYSWRQTSDIPFSIMLGTQLDYLAFALGLTVACALASRRTHLAQSSLYSRNLLPSQFVRQRDLFVSATLVLVGLSLYMYYVYKVGFSALMNFENYAEKHDLSRGLGPIKLGINLVAAGCLWAEASELRRTARNGFRGVGALTIFWSIAILSARIYALILILGYACLFFRKRNISLRTIRLGTLAAILMAWVSMEGFAMFRGAYLGDAWEAIEVLFDSDALLDHLGVMVAGSEFSHPFITCMEVQHVETPGALGGQSYLDTPWICLPLFLISNRPETLSERFAVEQYTNLVDRGGGTAFSLVGEAWWNFGPVAGAFVVALVLGSLLLWIESQCRRKPQGFYSRFTPYMMIVVLTAHRCPFSVVFKDTMLILLPALLLYGLFHALFHSPIHRQKIILSRRAFPEH